MNISDFNNEFNPVLSSFIRKIVNIDRNEKFCYGVTLSQCYAIETLVSMGSLSMNELSDEMGLAISTLTRNLDILERDGIIRRKRSSNDRRKVIVELSAKGFELSKRLTKCSQNFTDEILKNIPEKKKNEVLESLKLLNQAIKQLEVNICKPINVINKDIKNGQGIKSKRSRKQLHGKAISPS